MKILLIASAIVVTTGCSTFTAPESEFNRTLDRAHAVDCNVKSLEWTRQRTRLECFDWQIDNPIPSRLREQRGSDT